MSDGLLNALRTAAGAIDAYSTGVGAVAHNLANVSTDGFQPIRVAYEARERGVAAVLLPENESLTARDADPSATDLAAEFVNLINSTRSFEANARVATVVDETLGSVVNLKG